MEKSLLSFATAYPTWEPGLHAKQLLAAVASHPLQAGPHFPYTAHASQFHPAMRAGRGEQSAPAVSCMRHDRQCDASLKVVLWAADVAEAGVSGACQEVRLNVVVRQDPGWQVICSQETAQCS